MTTSIMMAAAGATLFWSVAAQAAPSPQQHCDAARISAWKTYSSCVDAVVAKDATGVFVDRFAGFARCQHTYFTRWTRFQNPNRKPSLAGSTCIGTRYTDNGDQTVTDQLTALVWEKKHNLDSSGNAGDPHDADNLYTWSTGAPYAENGTTFTDFLRTVNGGAGFGGAHGWRLPTLAELHSIMLDFPCRGDYGTAICGCPEIPCVDPALDSGNTQPDFYWSGTTYLPDPFIGWTGDFFSLGFNFGDKTDGHYVQPYAADCDPCGGAQRTKQNLQRGRVS